jgi:hypothetical protein
MKGAEALMKARSFTLVSSDPTEFDALTLHHNVLHGRPNLHQSHSEFDAQHNLLSNWWRQNAQKIVTYF